MENGVYNIKSLFALGDVQQLVIPEVQRDYVWKKNNCNRLFHSIYNSFKSRKHNLPDYSVILDDKIRTELENKFIEENSRVNLGFIYAYHDADYIGKQFIIDGQQRFTTIFLIILACYKSLEQYKDFNLKYFKDNVPKLDYKVREASHDFVIELIKDQCKGNGINKIDERLWWRPDFDYDISVRNLINNYSFLYDEINKIPSEELPEFLKFLEINIDFKFFDISQSEQGEQLYLFMNSRGIRLAFQEKVRALIIAAHGLGLGVFWEDAQQYFWEKKMVNKDSELGFNEFLKWAVIIHLALNNKDYIEYESLINRPTTENQLELLESYIAENICDFNKEYLEGIFNSVKYFFEIEAVDSIQNNLVWLTAPDFKIMPMRIYLKLIPVIYYIYCKKLKSEINIDELRRVSAFIVNCNQSRTYQKNPQLWLMNFIKFIHNLCNDSGITSIMQFDTKSSQFIGRSFSKQYFETFNAIASLEDRVIFENFVIQMITNAENNNALGFLNGNYRIILSVLPENETFSNKISLMKYYCEKLEWFSELDFNMQRKLLLTFGDYSYQLSDLKFDYGQTQESLSDIFCNEDKFEILGRFLNERFNLDNISCTKIINDWILRNPISSIKPGLKYLHYLINYDTSSNYIAWGWGVNEYVIRSHTIRKTGYNSSYDIINYAVANSFALKKEFIISRGKIEGSRELSSIKIGKKKLAMLSMNYVPIDWEQGQWELNNLIGAKSRKYQEINDIIEKITINKVSINEDIVKKGLDILKILRTDLEKI